MPSRPRSRSGGVARVHGRTRGQGPMIIRGGDVVTPTGVEQADIVVADGRIAAIVAPGTAPLDASTVDATGLLVLPGMVDAHVHFDEPGRTEWEGFDTGSA